MYRYFKSDKHCVEVGFTFYQVYPKELISLVDLLYPYRDLPDDVILTSDDWDKITMNIYTQLLVSRIFCDNVRILNWTPWQYLQKIEEFYSQLDYLHLKDFFESQSRYFLKDFADEGDGMGVDAISCPAAKFPERRCGYASVKRVASELRMDGRGDSARGMVAGFVRNL